MINLANNTTIILVRCKPKNIGKLSGLLTITSNKIAAQIQYNHFYNLTGGELTVKK